MCICGMRSGTLQSRTYRALISVKPERNQQAVQASRITLESAACFEASLCQFLTENLMISFPPAWSWLPSAPVFLTSLNVLICHLCLLLTCVNFIVGTTYTTHVPCYSKYEFKFQLKSPQHFHKDHLVVLLANFTFNCLNIHWISSCFKTSWNKTNLKFIMHKKKCSYSWELTV